MYPSSARCAILLLTALSLDLIVASGENVTLLRRRATKTFTNFLKVPWINFDTPWIHEEQSTCRNDIATLSKSAAAAELWALQMLDATSKIPAGLLTGNILDLGMYEECIQIKPHHNSANIQGRHCMVSLAIPTKLVEDPSEILRVQKISIYNPTPDVELNFMASLCLPSSCSVGDITEFVKASIQVEPELAEFEVRVARVTCSRIESEVQVFTLGTVLTLSFFATIAILLIFCTACDFVMRSRSNITSPTLTTLAKFSLYTNAVKLMSTEVSPGTIPAIHGIRSLSMFSIVMAHRILVSLIRPVVNLSDMFVMRRSWTAPFIFLLPYAVDTFFLLSGFLTAFLFLKRLHSGVKTNIAQMYIHRYIRLTPSLAVVILFYGFIFPHVGSGPIWEMVVGLMSQFCRKSWWTNLLYVNNFVNVEEMCIGYTWYSAVEMQLFWICPIILYPLFYRPKLGLAMLKTLLVVTLITPAIHLALNQYSFFLNTTKIFSELAVQLVAIYMAPFNRALPYFVGIILGYYVTNGQKLTKLQITFNWILASVSIVVCLCTTLFVQPFTVTYNPGWEAAYVSVGRLSWCFVVAWIIYACTQGYGGPVGTFLSLPMFVPLSRMSYSIYLVSFALQLGTIAAEQTAGYNSILGLLYLVWGDLAISIPISLILSLCCEYPIAVIEKLLRARGSSRIVKGNSIKKKEKLLTIIREYPDLNHGAESSDLDIEIRMSQLHFWRSVTDVLNTLGKKSTKTPEEWLQMWQRWKADLLVNDIERKTGVKRIENGSASCETVLEKELLLFAAAVSSGIDDVAWLKATEISEPAESYLDSHCRKNERQVKLPKLNSYTLTEMARRD